MIKDIRQKRDLVLNRFSKEYIFDAVSNTLSTYEIMFMYFGGSLAYDCFEDGRSDIDINVFVDGFNGYIHTSCGNFDLFIYGKNCMMKRQHVADEMTNYNKIFIDDMCQIDNLLIYLNEKYKKEYEEFVHYDITRSLKKYLNAVYKYFMFLYVDNEEPLKRFYHVIRIRGQLENYKATRKYNDNLPALYKNEMITFKRNYDTEKGKEIYKNKIGTYLDYINEIMEELKDDNNWNSTNIY